jgi:hypothetical protein
MFGPESGKHGWNTLPFVYDKVRIAEEGDQNAKCEQFLSIFEREVIALVDRVYFIQDSEEATHGGVTEACEGNCFLVGMSNGGDVMCRA